MKYLSSSPGVALTASCSCVRAAWPSLRVSMMKLANIVRTYGLLGRRAMATFSKNCTQEQGWRCWWMGVGSVLRGGTCAHMKMGQVQPGFKHMQVRAWRLRWGYVANSDIDVRCMVIALCQLLCGPLVGALAAMLLCRHWGCVSLLNCYGHPACFVINVCSPPRKSLL